MKFVALGLILLTIQAVLTEEISSPSNEEVLNYELPESDFNLDPSMDRQTRSKFSRIMRSDKFARIVRGPTKLMRILRNGEQKFARIMRSDPQSAQMRVLRTPEVKFTRILRSEPRYLRILRSSGEEDNAGWEPDM